MLEQIAALVKQYGQQTVVDNPQVPNNLNNQVLAEATNTVTGGLQNLLSNGGLGNIISLFSGQQSSSGIMGNPIVGSLVSNLTSNLAAKFNLNPTIANAVANNIIPGVISTLVNKTRSNDPENDAFDLNDLVASFTGGDASADNRETNGIDFQDILSRVTGGNADKISLGGIIDSVTQQARQNQQGSQSGGLMDMIQGFFK
jgi:uncharacterized protein YidB (DUF937 family)